MSLRRSRIIFVALAVLVTGCPETTELTDETSGLPEIIQADAAWELVLPEVVEVLAPDLTTEDLDPVEVLLDLNQDQTQDTGGPQCNPGEGCFLDGCNENADCLSGWCVDHMGEAVCTQLCQSECPPGWSCQQVAGSDPDLIFVCVSDYTNLCRPCATGNDCKSAVGAEDVCVDYDSEGSFCGGTCGGNTDCPWGFTCKEVLTVDEIPTTQCTADAGVCPCTSTSIALSLWTPCVKTNEFGSCEGKRICSDDGLSDCDAGQPKQETCNALDDDCDGLTDEPAEVEGEFVSLCDDGNQCTKDSCTGEAGCQHEPQSGTECMDGDFCTTADHCQDGVCSGSPVICDDKNECTDDVCTESGGCEYFANSLECDDGDPCTVADQCKNNTCTGFTVACDCEVDADCESYEDGDKCNGTLFCLTDSLPYKCAVSPASIVTCPEPEGPQGICQKAACDPVTANCSLVPDHEEFACSSSNKCTVGQVCQSGECVGGFSLNCDDSKTCTIDSCDPDLGCVHAPADSACSDGNVCTSSDYCLDGECTPGPLLLCDDSNPCTADTCEPELGCVHTPTIAPDAFCCEQPSDCPPQFSSQPTCDVPATCQGSSTVALCADNQCGSTVSQDDSACVLPANDCGLYKDILCNGESEQIPKVCINFCLSDQDCDPFAFCDGTCKAKVAIGEQCTTDPQCESGNCSPSPGGIIWYCTAPMHECALEEGTGVNDGFKYCFDGDVWLCEAADTWIMTECADECGYYLPIDGCQAAKCKTCPVFCAVDADCDANAHCDGECLVDIPASGPCDEDSDCVSDNCGAAPSGGDYCISLKDECALDDGSSVDEGYSLCINKDMWTCLDDDLWGDTDCAADCGFYLGVDDCIDGHCGVCPKACVEDSGCDPDAHCDETCLEDVVDGGQCDEQSDCISGYCNNSFCCSQGDCCLAAEDCPLKYQVAPLCDDASTCQGHRVDADCIESICSSQMVDDDSACDVETLADECGLYPSIFCLAKQDQTAPTCLDICATDDDCDDGAHCDDSVCLADLEFGIDCDENSDCAGDLCHNNRCCKEACTTDGCSTGSCDEAGDCALHTSGHQNCDLCHACDGDGTCQPQSAEGSNATALGCVSGEEGCRRCDNGSCGVFTSGQHACGANHECNAQGNCAATQDQYYITCFGGFPQNAWVSSYCPGGYHHLYHVCGGGDTTINNYDYGPHHEDKYIANNGGHCSCCCNCGRVCIKCELN
jgi:hypothetical protein